KGVAAIHNVSGKHSVHSEAENEWQQNCNIKPDVERGSIAEEPCVGKLQARFCEGCQTPLLSDYAKGVEL
ncbi:MAG: hypothetical protein QMD22_08990, partial [archaeon]|nr:hypothetical protein [archaeon]